MEPVAFGASMFARRRRYLTAAAIGHASLALRPLMAGHRFRQMAVRTGVVASDLVLAWRLGRKDDPESGGWRLALETLGAWSWALDAPISDDTLRDVYVWAAVPHATEAGLRATLGSSGWGPARQLWRLVAPALSPAVAMAFARRHRGQPGGAGLSAWGIAATAVGAALGLEGKRLQRRMEQRFAEDVRPRLLLEDEAARLRVATKASPGHDFKKTLLTLGMLGSREAWEAGHAQAAEPGVLLAQLAEGVSLFEAARSADLWVDPPTAGAHWISRRQAESLARFVATVRAEEPASIDADGASTLTVLAVERSEITVAHLGRQAVIADPIPPPRGMLDLLLVGALVSGFWKAARLAVEPRSGRHRALAGVVLADALLAASVVAFGPSEWLVRWGVIYELLSGATFDLVRTVGLKEPARAPKGPGTNGMMGATIVTGAYWSQLGGLRRLLVPLLFILWAVTDADWDRGFGPAVQSLLWLPQLLVATHDFRAPWAIDGERLRQQLRTQLEGELEAIRTSAADRELARMRADLELVRSELGRLDGALDPDTRSAIRADCEDLEEWLGLPGRREWLCS